MKCNLQVIISVNKEGECKWGKEKEESASTGEVSERKNNFLVLKSYSDLEPHLFQRYRHIWRFYNGLFPESIYNCIII